MRTSVLSVAPAETPVSIDEVKMHCRYTDNDFDSMFARYLGAAIEYCQEYQWSQLCTATYIDKFDRFPNVIELLRNPVQSVISVQYVDTAGNTQTLTANTDYTVDTSAKPCRIVAAYTKWWPATRGFVGDVTVTYVAGYGAASAVPDEIKNAVILKAASQFQGCTGADTDASVNMYLDKKSFRVYY